LQQQISKKLFRGIFFHDRVCMPLDQWLVKCEKNPTQNLGESKPQNLSSCFPRYL